MAEEGRDLLQHSMSFREMIVKYRDKLAKAASGAASPLFTWAAGVPGHAVNQADKGLLKDSIYALAQASGLPERLDPAIEKTLNAIAGSYDASDAARLLLAARAARLDHPDGKGLRLVDRKLSFEEARRSRWTGTLVEARRGSGLDKVDFKQFFVIYVPGVDLGFRSSFELKIVDRLVQ